MAEAYARTFSILVPSLMVGEHAYRTKWQRVVINNGAPASYGAEDYTDRNSIWLDFYLAPGPEFCYVSVDDILDALRANHNITVFRSSRPCAKYEGESLGYKCRGEKINVVCKPKVTNHRYCRSDWS